nr:MAG TPA: hypothetical protein [Caudoviricetes sp.]
MKITQKRLKNYPKRIDKQSKTCYIIITKR